jgi:hypothetical protein
MCALKSRGMSAVCTWGLRGILFLTLVLFVLISHGAVRCFVAGLFPTYVPYNFKNSAFYVEVQTACVCVWYL